jgi:hypothetical protein
MDHAGSHRADQLFPVDVGRSAMPSWPSRLRSAGWIVVLVVGLGALAAVAVTMVVLVGWVLISGAVT